jgi:hypothetical protein
MTKKSITYLLAPNPKSAVFNSKKLDLHNHNLIFTEKKTSLRLQQAIYGFRDQIAKYFAKDINICSGRSSEDSVLLGILIDDSLPAQNYRIICSKYGIRLWGGDETGVFYGIQTLKQLIFQSGAYPVSFEIEDGPDFITRGFLFDTSRGKIPKLEELYKIIDFIAELKYNQFQLYLKHTFAFSGHEIVWAGATPYTAEDIQAIDKYCHDHFIEMVPYFPSFGHVETWLKHPEYFHLAECPSGFKASWGVTYSHGTVLKPAQASLDFLHGLYKELLPNFSSKLFNIGCDETFELGLGYSKKRCQKIGKEYVYLNFLNKIWKLAGKFGKTSMFWGDIILHSPELIEKLPKDIIALNWGYEADHPFAEETAKFADAGIPFYVCPGTSSWRSLLGRTAICRQNLLNAAENGLKNGAIGYLNTDWGDYGHHQFIPISYPGMVMGAAFSWNLQSNRDINTAAILDKLVFQDTAQVIGSWLIEAGQVEETKTISNGTVHNLLLFWDMKESEYKKFVDWKIDTKKLEKIKERLIFLKTQLSLATPQCNDAEIILGELDCACDMALIGIERGIASLEPKSVCLQDMRNKLFSVIGRYEKFWIQRNRIGGLYDSSSYLRSSLKTLEKYLKSK